MNSDNLPISHKYYVDPQGKLLAFEEDGSQDSFIPSGLTRITRDQAVAILNPVPPQEEALQLLAKQFDEAVEAHLHKEAVSRGYTNIERACMYASFTNPYQAESQSFVEWVGVVWAYCYRELNRVQAGTRPIPIIDQFLDELPKRNTSGLP